jgi:membrane protein required for colicin V production
MNSLDYFLTAILIISTVSGFRKGFARMTVGLVTIVLAFALASWFHAPAGEWSLDYVNSKSVANMIGYVVVFFGVMIAGTAVGHYLGKLFKWIGFSWVDRLGGSALGVLRGGLTGLIVVMVIAAFLPGDPPKPIVASVIAPYLLEGASTLSMATPKEMKEQFRQTYVKAKKAWIDPLKPKNAPSNF